MFFRKLFFAFGIFVLTASMFWAAPASRAETEALKGRGQLLTIDLRAKTLQLRQDNGATKTLKFSKKTKFVRNGKNSRAKALLLRDALEIKYQANLNVIQVTATGPAGKRIAGKLNDAIKGSGMLSIDGKLVHSTAQTHIVRNGAIVSLSQLTRADTVVAHVKRNAANANAQTEAFDLIANGPKEQKVEGTISALTGNQIVIAAWNGSVVATWNITPETMIEVDGRAATLSELAVGMQVEAHYDPTTWNVYTIETDSDGPFDDVEINGVITALDAAGGITIAPAVGAPVALTVNSSTEIQVDDAPAALTDLAVGMTVEAEYDAATWIAQEIEADDDADDDDDDDANYQELEGVVTAVNLAAQTVTITPEGGGSAVTLNVTAETDIEINDVDATLAEIPIGAEADVTYNTLDLNVHELDIGDDDDDDSAAR